MEVLLGLFADTSTYHRVAFEFGALATHWGILLLVICAVVSFVVWYRSLTRGPLAIAILRAAAILITLFLVLSPTLVGYKAVPGKQFVILLFDNSKSMTILEPDGSTRSQKLTDALAADNFGLARRLGKTHQLAHYGFGSDVHRIRSTVDLRYDEARTDIVGSLDRVRGRAAGTDVAAIVLFSDGIQQTANVADLGTLPDDTPVFTVGAGTHRNWTSLALTDLATSRSPFDQSPVTVTVGVSATGLAGEQVVIEILDGNRRVATDAFEVLSDTLIQKRKLEFVPDRPGWIAYRGRIRMADQPFEGQVLIGMDKDPITDDNVRDFVVDNRERIYRVLYFSGRPNWEHKFARRSLTQDSQIEVASLIRISGAEKKFVFRGNETSMSNPLFEGYDDDADLAPRYDEAVFLRIGVRQSELVTGYPLKPKDLFGYHLIIWSEVESELFSAGHLELTRDFVSKRGGTLLAIGGPRSLAEGGYGGSIIEPMLPVVLPAQGKRDLQTWSQSITPRPTMQGILSGMWSLHPDPEENRQLWEDLPNLFGLNAVLTTRAGADVYARGSSRSVPVDQPLFALQRYGEGACAVLATGETWPWEMLTVNPDPSHGRFWRQMTRSLLANVPNPVVFPEVNDVVSGEPLDLNTHIRDSTFVSRESLTVLAVMTGPDDVEHTLAVEESIERAGVYATPFTPTAPGMYQLAITATEATGRRVAQDDHAFIVHPDNRERLRPKYGPEFLQRISEQTGGRFFTLAELDELPDHIPWEQTRSDQVDRIPLWHAPPFYAVLVLLFVIEWYWRRKQGHP